MRIYKVTKLEYGNNFENCYEVGKDSALHIRGERTTFRIEYKSHWIDLVLNNTNIRVTHEITIVKEC